MDWLAEETPTTESKQLATWKVVIVDDDIEVHKVTKMAIGNFTFEGRGLELVSLYRGDEAKKYFSEHDDIALVFLDVVMESTNAGLEVVKYIRNELGNHYTRIILRTGQPGTAPEHEVIQNYDIDGYKAKTQITVKTLQHAIYIALRSYRDLIRIQSYLKGLEALINSMCNLTQIHDVLDLSSAVLEQMKSVLNAENTHFLIKDSEAYSFVKSDRNQWGISIEESKAAFVDEAVMNRSNANLMQLAQKAFNHKVSLIEPPYYCHYFQSSKGSETVFIIKSKEKFKANSLRLIKLFSMNIVLAIENLLLYKHEGK